MFNTILLQMDTASLTGMLPFLLMFVVIYLFMIRPQMKKAKNEKKFQSELAKGAKVVTTSGIHGKVLDLVDSDNTVIIETGAGKIKFERSAISMDLSKKYLPKEKK
ncbi:protein translocase subunit yajC [Lutibacter oricola]|uniref:Sec translocon accessory complex subunit YajC n=1 Tax=Lutibacter oricola TaxID=762486 RepID=A0A1H2W918_9FLAO|nr:preprotein translocase subunit YajC [Lutibacter oricola]SDW77080.1 protein translocase subunit yajC [Lutibacter oricola]